VSSVTSVVLQEIVAARETKLDVGSTGRSLCRTTAEACATLMTPQTLLIDADDTLWESNVYFERAIHDFIQFVDHQHYSHQQVRAILDDIERANVALHGYGSAAFGRNLQEAFRKLAAGPISNEQLDYVAGLAAAIAQQDLQIIAGVPETLDHLKQRGHRLVLLTKGSEDEQHAKAARSGLAAYFTQARVVREKDAEAYRCLAAELSCDPCSTWMVGNSPRSDINPALAAGLNAVWVPHANTWTLEKEELRNGPGRLAVIASFSGLRDMF
jgi:putative hydrolase of the HAD superfamily